MKNVTAYSFRLLLPISSYFVTGSTAYEYADGSEDGDGSEMGDWGIATKDGSAGIRRNGIPFVRVSAPEHIVRELANVAPGTPVILPPSRVSKNAGVELSTLTVATPVPAPATAAKAAKAAKAPRKPRATLPATEAAPEADATL